MNQSLKSPGETLVVETVFPVTQSNFRSSSISMGRCDIWVTNTNQKLSNNLKNTNQKLSNNLKNTNQKLSNNLKNTNQKLSNNLKNREKITSNANTFFHHGSFTPKLNLQPTGFRLAADWLLTGLRLVNAVGLHWYSMVPFTPIF